MTKFDELIDIITHNRNKDEKSTLASKANEHEDIELQVSGSESTRARSLQLLATTWTRILLTCSIQKHVINQMTVLVLQPGTPIIE